MAVAFRTKEDLSGDVHETTEDERSMWEVEVVGFGSIQYPLSGL
jgi:hypothetical protein